MNAMTTTRVGGPFTRADLDALPNDGRRHELIDGVLLLSPAPSYRHQLAVTRLLLLLGRDCPRDLELLTAPFDVVLANDTIVEPDVLVGRRSDFTQRDLPAPPVLAVEVLSPSTRRFDLELKRSLFETAGVVSYWVVDPIEPSLRAWDLVGGGYVEQVFMTGDDSWTARVPYAVTLCPARLVADHHGDS